MPADLSLWGNIVFNSFWKNKNFLKLYSLSFFSRAGGGSGGGLDRGGLVVVVLPLDRGIGSGLRVWIFILRSESSLTTGGGSGGGLVRGNGLGSEGDSRNVDGVGVLGLGKGLVWVSMSKSGFATRGGSGGGLF